MNKRKFIRENREAIDAYIHKQLGKDYKLNDREREEWISNDESLYNFARKHQLSF